MIDNYLFWMYSTKWDINILRGGWKQIQFPKYTGSSTYDHKNYFFCDPINLLFYWYRLQIIIIIINLLIIILLVYIIIINNLYQ
jgi:hypothetical protein